LIIILSSVILQHRTQDTVNWYSIIFEYKLLVVSFSLPPLLLNHLLI